VIIPYMCTVHLVQVHPFFHILLTSSLFADFQILFGEFHFVIFIHTHTHTHTPLPLHSKVLFYEKWSVLPRLALNYWTQTI
jgi:hypothetical protein